jgi:hypothetical protein
MSKFNAFSKEINTKISDRPTITLMKKMFESVDEKLD